MLFILALGFGRAAVTVASGALPGDALYPVKRLTERTRMVLTVNPQQRVKLEQELNQVRLMEVKQVVAQGRQEPVEIPGVIGFIAGDTWTIVGLDSPVIVPKAIVQGRVPRVGNRVLIRALPDDQGKLVALSVIVLKDKPIQSPSDDTPTPPTRPTRPRATEEPELRCHPGSANAAPPYTHGPCLADRDRSCCDHGHSDTHTFRHRQPNARCHPNRDASVH